MLLLNLNLWNITENKFQKSSLPINDWNNLEKNTFSLNTKSMNALFCALNKNEFNQVSIYEMINLLMHDFEMFCMMPSETIVDMYTHFRDVINSLKGIGKCFSNLKLINKILRSLPKSWI